MPDPDERAFLADLEATSFQTGVDADTWRLERLHWPNAVFAVTGGDGQPVGVRVNLDDYPTTAPAGRPWDLATDTPLPPHRWPEAGAEARPFRRDWSAINGDAPYIAADRVPLLSHPDWAINHPERAWHPGRDIAFYLAEIARELRGTRTPPANP